MIFSQAFTALIFLIIAGDFSSIHGGWAYRLGIPLAGVAQHSFWLVPFAAMLPCILPRRIPARVRVLACDLLVMGVVVFPIMVFSLGSRVVTFTGDLPSGITEQLREELGFPVVIVSDSHGSHIYFPHAEDPAVIWEALRRDQLHPNASASRESKTRLLRLLSVTDPGYPLWRLFSSFSNSSPSSSMDFEPTKLGEKGSRLSARRTMARTANPASI